MLSLLDKIKISEGEKVTDNALYELDKDLEKTSGDARLAQDVTTGNP